MEITISYADGTTVRVPLANLGQVVAATPTAAPKAATPKPRRKAAPRRRATKKAAPVRRKAAPRRKAAAAPLWGEDVMPDEAIALRDSFSAAGWKSYCYRWGCYSSAKAKGVDESALTIPEPRDSELL